MAMHTSETPIVFGLWSPTYSLLLAVLLTSAISAATLAGPLYRHVHDWRHNVALLMTTTIFSLAAAEIAIRWLDLFGVSYYADAEKYHRAKVPDTDLYYTHEPNTTASYRDFSVRINSLGMRGAEIPTKQPDEYRILFLGDSVAFGWGVEEDQTFVRQVGSLLSETLGRTVRALNSGVGGYNTENEWAFLNRHGERLDPDLVALVYVLNDIELTPDTPFDPMDMARPGEMAPPQLITWLMGKSWIYRTIVHFRRYRTYSTAGAAALADIRGNRGWITSEEALIRISDWCETRGIPFVTYFARITTDPLSDALAPALVEIGTEKGFQVIDTLVWFEAENVREMTNSLVDSHPNAAGHAVIANGIANSIERIRLER